MRIFPSIPVPFVFLTIDGAIPAAVPVVECIGVAGSCPEAIVAVDGHRCRVRGRCSVAPRLQRFDPLPASGNHRHLVPRMWHDSSGVGPRPI